MELMKFKDLRSFLCGASETAVRRMIAEGKLPAGRQTVPGGSRYWIRSEIEESIKNL